MLLLGNLSSMSYRWITACSQFSSTAFIQMEEIISEQLDKIRQTGIWNIEHVINTTQLSPTN